MQPQGECCPQTKELFHPLHGQDQVKNDEGGYVYSLKDYKRLERFLIIGSEQGTYYASKEEVERENVTCLDRLVSQGGGKDAVKLIKEISVARRNIKQNSLLYAFALCCRNNDEETKAEAYSILPDVCRIPTHLFMFINFCEAESVDGTGWGRAHRRAISNWYCQFKGRAEKLAWLVTKYKGREKWNHQDVIRLSHARCLEDYAVAFILRYIAKDYQSAVKTYVQDGMEENDPVKDIARAVKAYDEAIQCTNVEELCSMIREYHLAWEHLPSSMLRKREVWEALLHSGMPLVALIRNLGRMSNLGLFAPNSENEEIVLRQLRSINTDDMLVEEEDIEEALCQEGRAAKKSIHPFLILIAYCQYKHGRGDKGHLRWEVNERIKEGLDDAFYRAFQEVVPTNKKFCLAVDVSSSMSQPVLGVRSLTCASAAAAMLMTTARTEQDFHILAFREKLVDLDVSPQDRLEDILRRTGNLTAGSTDCSQPMMWAIEQKKRDIDVFVVYTDNQTWFGNLHPSEALRQYREYAGNPNVKLIVCGMCATKFTIAELDDNNMLDVVGFDSATPKLIAEFAMGNFS